MFRKRTEPQHAVEMESAKHTPPGSSFRSGPGFQIKGFKRHPIVTGDEYVDKM